MRKSVNERWANQRFGRLYIVRAWVADKVTLASCRCDCGTVWECRVGDVKSGNTSSCGCYSTEAKSKRATTHGMTDTRVYKVWTDMKKRCFNSKHKAFKHYGGRGIMVCQSWAESFEAFLQDMGEPTTPSHELDRVDVNGNYEPGNCRWATRIENMRNKRKSIFVSLHGRRVHLKDAAHITGVPYITLYYRYRTGQALV